jgi:hypothetical protein
VGRQRQKEEKGNTADYLPFHPHSRPTNNNKKRRLINLFLNKPNNDQTTPKKNHHTPKNGHTQNLQHLGEKAPDFSRGDESPKNLI